MSRWLGAALVAAGCVASIGACSEDLGVETRRFACESDRDCLSGFACRVDSAGSGGRVCLVDDGATCNDGLQNGDEAGVDCGGTLCPTCDPCAGLTWDDPLTVAVEALAVGASCGVGACDGGQVDCLSSARTLLCSTAIAVDVETCDGVDNDCDGDTDEGVAVNVEDECSVSGVCAAPGAVTVDCVQGRWVCTVVDGIGYESPEELSCDGVDNDCDGETDEVSGDPTTAGCSPHGVCATHVDRVVASCVEGDWQCDYSNVPGYQAGVETSCDGLDNDCDGVPDEDFGVGAGCDGDDADACAGGVVKCDGSDGTFCDESSGNVAVELCDSLDNDCDGKTDEPFKAGPDSAVTLLGALFIEDRGKQLGDGCGAGVCAGGTVVCSADHLGLACSTDVHAESETCDEQDNDCDGVTDDGFADVDRDGIGDPCDPCVDADGDGYGRAGFASGGCPHPGIVDCDDTIGNGADEDGDNICVTGTRPPCDTGGGSGCDDNCPKDANRRQVDMDDNGVGDACDCINPEPYDVCDDCIDNDCDGTVDGAGCVERSFLRISPAEPIPAGYSVTFSFDHSGSVSTGGHKGGADVQLYRRSETGWAAIDRVLDPRSEWGTDKTRVWFATGKPRSSTTLSLDHAIYFTTDELPRDDERDVFHTADFFERADSGSLGRGWAEAEGNSAFGGATEVGLKGGALTFIACNNRDFSPAAALAFPKLQSGRWQWRFGMNIVARQLESEFAILMQLGLASQMETPEPSRPGSWATGGEVNLMWADASNGVTAGTLSARATRGSLVAIETLNAPVDVRVDVDIDGASYDVRVGQGVRSGVISTNGGIIDTVRFIAHRVDESFYESLGYDYLLVRPLPTSKVDEPQVTVVAGGSECATAP